MAGSDLPVHRYQDRAIDPVKYEVEKLVRQAVRKELRERGDTSLVAQPGAGGGGMPAGGDGDPLVAGTVFVTIADTVADVLDEKLTVGTGLNKVVGDAGADEFLQLWVEIDSGAAFPVTPVAWQLFYRTDESLLYLWDGAVWQVIGAGVTVHNDLTGRDAAGCHPAASITNTPAGQIAAVEVQAALNELDTEKASTTLNNLGTTAANADILPAVLGGASLGTLAKRWLQLYVESVWAYLTVRNRSFFGSTTPGFVQQYEEVELSNDFITQWQVTTRGAMADKYYNGVATITPAAAGNPDRAAVVFGAALPSANYTVELTGRSQNGVGGTIPNSYDIVGVPVEATSPARTAAGFTIDMTWHAHNQGTNASAGSWNNLTAMCTALGIILAGTVPLRSASWSVRMWL